MTAVTVHLDVRTLPTWERHPRVFAALDALPSGGELIVDSDHEPRPLRYELDQQRGNAFLWDARMLDEEMWRVTIKRISDGSAPVDLKGFLRHCATLADLDDSTIARLAAGARERALVSSEVLVGQGERLDALPLVRTGVIAAIASSAKGREQLLYEALPFETCAEIETFDGGACPARLVAAYGAANVVLISRSTAIEVAHRSPMFALRLGMRTALRARIFAERLTYAAGSSTTARIARALLAYAGPAAGMMPALPPLSEMSQEQIATIAGTVRIVAARDLAKLVNEGAIVLERGKVTRIDRARLSAIIR